MALTPAFTVSQSFSTPSILNIVDSSTGTDGTITQRRVYLRKSDGTYLVPTGTTTDYIQWSYAVSFIDIDVLDQDYALDITVQWLNVSNVVVYTEQDTFRFDLESQFFSYGLLEDVATDNTIIADANFIKNAYWLDTLIQGATNAITYGSNIQASQACLDKAKQLIDNANFYF
jgi:hypothetical protein